MGENLKKVQKVVTLKVYYGSKVSLSEDGTIQNRVEDIKIIHDTNEWRAVLYTLRLSGYARVDVTAVKWVKEGYPLVEDYSDIKTEVAKAFNPIKEENLTPEQKRIAELEAKLERLLNAGKQEVVKTNVEEVESTEVESEEIDEQSIEEARAEYTEKVGKKPFGGWDIETIKERQAEHLAK